MDESRHVGEPVEPKDLSDADAPPQPSADGTSAKPAPSPPGLMEPAAGGVSGDLPSEVQSGAATPEEPAAPATEQTAPPTEVELSSICEAEAARQAPDVRVDEPGPDPAATEIAEPEQQEPHAPEPPVPAPMQTAVGRAAPVAPEPQVAEPRQGEVREGAPPSAEAEPSHVPPLPTSAQAAAAAPQLIEAAPAPMSRLQDPPQRPVSAWLPPSPEAIKELLPYLRLAVRGAAALVLALVVIVLALVVLYRWVDPPVSTLMLGQRLGGTPIERRWVPLERISPHLIRAIVLSEDGGFCRHRGVDWRALEEAIESARGGSTITMQVVKNLFLWPSRSYVRKAIEIGLAYLVELIWPKRRILEIYLNIAEWGDGVFGAEAAARLNFTKSAARLTPEEAALLAVSLPSPIERTPASPSPGMRRLAAKLLVRMQTSRTSLTCVRARAGG